MIRTLLDTDLEPASALCMRSFMQAVAPSLSAAGVATFTTVASVEGFVQRGMQDNLQLVFVDTEGLKGVAELKQGRHVSMLFVDPHCQHQGIGEALLAALIEQARTPVLSVSASLPSVRFYERYGFKCSGEVDESAGLVYQPMEKAMLTASVPPAG